MLVLVYHWYCLERKYTLNPISNEKVDANKNIVDKPEDSNESNCIIKDNITIDKSHLNGLDPKFKDSIEDIINVLNYNLKDISLSNYQKKLLETQIEGIVQEVKNIPTYEKIPNDSLTDLSKSANGYNNEGLLNAMIKHWK